MIESLTFIVREACNKGLISGVEIGKDRVMVTHLQYADDTILFLPKDTNALLNYRSLLDCFSIMSGLQINYNKSTLVSWNKKNVWVEEMCRLIKFSS